MDLKKGLHSSFSQRGCSFSNPLNLDEASWLHLINKTLWKGHIRWTISFVHRKKKPHSFVTLIQFLPLYMLGTSIIQGVYVS